MEVIHFEDLGNMGFFGGTAVPTEARLKEQLAEKGVLFDSPGGAVAVVNLGVGHARSGTLGIGGITAGGALSYGLEAPVTVRFMRVNSAQELVIATTEQVEVWIDRLTGAPGEVTLQAFGLANELLGSVSTADSPEHPYLRIEQKGIHQITITGNGHTALDDLWYAPPEQVEIRLEAKVRNRGLELSWPRVGGYMLESTRTLNPPILWQEISSEEGFARVALDEPERYFRLRRMNQQVEKLR
jgi:hypothetical protein